MGKKKVTKLSQKSRFQYVGATNASSEMNLFKLPPNKRNQLTQLVDELLHHCITLSPPCATSQNISKEWDDYIEIWNLLSRIQDIERDIEPPALDRTLHFDALLAWLKEHGSSFDGIKISKFPDCGYGLKAIRDFDQWELVLTVPDILMMTIDNAKQSLLGQLIDCDPLLQNMPNITLSLFLLLEKHNPHSFWKPYISSLPNKYNTVMYFKPEELQYLKGSPVFGDALKQCRNIARQYAYFYRMFQRCNDSASEILQNVFTFNQYRWATSAVMTRQNSIPSSKDESVRIIALIPLWDMCNHTNATLSTDFNNSLRRCECLAYRPFSEGEQFLISYGARPNSALFLHNGFILSRPENYNDALAIYLGISRDDPLHSLRTKVLDKINIPTTGAFYIKLGPQPVDGPLLAFLRVFNMSKEHLENWLDAGSCSLDLKHPDCTLPADVEDRVWKFLLARVTLLLKSYPDSSNKDEQLLKTSGLNEHSTMALHQRIGEKKILANVILYVEQRIFKEI